MTINAAPSTPISINTLILLAYKRAGVIPVETKLSGANMVPKLEHGRQLLDLIIDGLATDGFMARSMEFYDLPMIAGESQYALPDTILDVFEDAMFVPGEPVNYDTKHTTGELVCKQIDLAAWQTLTTKGSISTRPTLYAAFRSGATVELRFWPVPSEAGTMRLKTVRLLGSNADGTKQVDLHRYWFDALVWCLAYVLAVDSSMPVDKIAFLASAAEAKKKKCVSYAYEHTGSTAVLTHPSWGYGRTWAW
jgi:hypothetical protein